jgi:hypothetical protein
MKYFGVLIFLFLSIACFSQTNIYYVDKNNINDSKYFLNYLESLSILDTNSLLLITNDNNPYIFKGAEIKKNISIIEGIRNNTNNDSLELSILSDNILKFISNNNMVFNVNFFLSKNQITDDMQDFYYRIPNKLILALNLSKSIDFKIYFMIPEGELTITDINTLNNKNNNYEIQTY